jgi:hypothetical protein
MSIIKASRSTHAEQNIMLHLVVNTMKLEAGNGSAFIRHGPGTMYAKNRSASRSHLDQKSTKFKCTAEICLIL